jgi:hypothetical protein
MKSWDERREERRREEDRAFGDAVYEAYRRGYNSDLVDRERISHDIAEGCSDDEAAAREVRRVKPKPRPEEYEPNEEPWP